MTQSSGRITPPSARSFGTMAMPPRGLARTTTSLVFNIVWPDRSTNGRSAWASNTSMGSWVVRPISGRLISIATRPRCFHGSASPVTTSPPILRTTPSSTCAISTRPHRTSRSSFTMCPAAAHSPHQPTKEWIDKFHGKFDMGWEKLRDQIFANQKRLGVIPANTQLTPWPDGQAAYGGAKLPRWDSLSMIQKKALCARGRSLRRIHRLYRL